MFLIGVLAQLIGAAYDRLVNGGAPRVFPEGIGIMAVTLAVNLFVVAYEEREARRLNSEVLRADAKHTRSDVLTSGAVLGALIGVWWGYPLLDPLAALVVAAFIGRACWSIAQEASRILSDEIVHGQGSADEAVPAPRGRGHPHRATATGKSQIPMTNSQTRVDRSVWGLGFGV